MPVECMKQDNEVWEVIIVGAGPAGCAAAMVLARCRRKVLIFDDGNPRNIKSQGIHNYLTRDGVLPSDFHKICRSELKTYGVEVRQARVITAKADDGIFTVADAEGNSYQAKRLLIATGVTDIIPDIPGMQELWGRGVYHCPYCDGWALQDKVVGLYARKYSGYGMALALRQLADKVILFTDNARYLKVEQRRHLDSVDVQIVATKVSQLSCDKGKLTCVQLSDGSSIGCNVLFVHNGVRYNNDLVLQLGGKCSAAGAILTNRQQQCNVKGVYVAGDTSFDMQFVTVAAAEGAKAAVAINNSLLQENNAIALGYLSSVKSKR
jgi:thioredoxin reductase